MNKSELIEAVAGAAGLEKRQAEAAIGAFVESVVTKTKAGEAVSIFGFGTFKPTARAARKGRNPQTGAPVKIAASKGVKFQPATAFKTVLNTRGAAKKAAVKKAAPAVKKTATKAAPAKAAAKTTKATATKATATKAPAKKAAPAKAATKATKTTAKKAAPAAKATKAVKTAAVKTTTAAKKAVAKKR